MRQFAVAAFAAMLATSAQATDRYSVSFGSCYVAHVRINGDGVGDEVVTYRESDKTGSCGDAFGSGLIINATIDGITSEWVFAGVTYNFDTPYQETLMFEYPFVNGGHVFLTVSKHGKRALLYGMGSYTFKKLGRSQ